MKDVRPLQGFLRYALAVISVAGFTATPPAIKAADPDAYEISWVEFTDSNYDTMVDIYFSTASGSPHVTGIAFVNNNDLITGGRFTQIQAFLEISGIHYLLVGYNGTPTAYKPVNGLSASGTSASHIFRLTWDDSSQEFTFSKLTTGYNGSGDGVGYEIIAMYLGGDTLYLGGMFSTAGGWSSGRGFAGYKFDGNGWGNLMYWPMNVLGPSSAAVDYIGFGGGSSIYVGGSIDVEGYQDQYGYHWNTSGNYDAIWDPSSKSFSTVY